MEIIASVNIDLEIIFMEDVFLMWTDGNVL
jgi:hypothetical protein